MNEVALHRGRNTHLTVVDTYFDGQHLTEAVVSSLHFCYPLCQTYPRRRLTVSCFPLRLDRLRTLYLQEALYLTRKRMPFFSLL